MRFTLLFFWVWLLWPQCSGQTVETWPDEVREISYLSAADNTSQPALFYAPATNKPQPLLIALHTWSSDYKQPGSIPYARWCLAHKWVFIHPNFRGPNVRPEATGSELVIQDIVSAVKFAQQRARVDPARIYLVGVSGGGYLALLLAGRTPEIWAGVSAWAAASDLTAWYHESKKAGRKYAGDIAAACGGVPENNNAAERECLKRSPLTYLVSANQVPLDINVGIQDGHTGSIPISHSLRAFNLLAGEAEQLTEAEISYFVKEVRVPAHLQSKPSDPLYGQKQVLFRRQANQARLTIFDGGHEIIHEAALQWLAKQRRPNLK
jgi:dienelactone hydrolase